MLFPLITFILGVIFSQKIIKSWKILMDKVDEKLDKISEKKEN